MVLFFFFFFFSLSQNNKFVLFLMLLILLIFSLSTSLFTQYLGAGADSSSKQSRFLLSHKQSILYQNRAEKDTCIRVRKTSRQ